jgi:hypothetical protein
MRFLILIILLASWCVCYSQTDHMAEWGKPISYDDFQAKPDNADTAAAWISVTIELGYVPDKQGILKFQSRALMDKSQSWIKLQHRRNNVLVHEQGHFDLAHIIAKKLETNLKDEGYTKDQVPRIEQVYDQFLQLLNDLETQYDRQTKGGLNREQQEKWNEQIQKDLKSIQ